MESQSRVDSSLYSQPHHHNPHAKSSVSIANSQHQSWERVMVSREQKRDAMYKKLQLLRSVTNSHAQSKTSIILDASRYIEELKQKVEQLNQEEVVVAQNSSDEQIPMPVVRVEGKEKGFLINVLTESSCPGLLVFILEAFEELGLDVLQARVSCSSSFHLEAVGGKENTQGQVEHVDAQVVKQAVLRAIENWNESSEQERSN